MSQIAVGVTVFKRINKLEALLSSIDADFAPVVYVSDDGEWSKRKEEVYSRSYPFDLKVFDLEYDAGLGAGRNKIVQEMTEDYLLLMDSDMQMPENVGLLLEQLEADPDLGGVCGLFAEENRIFTSGCTDIFLEDDVCKLDIREPKRIEWVANYPFVQFDMIANAALFRRECLDEYSWDPNYVIGREHADFYIGQKQRTNWKFGLSPSVLFPHYPGGSNDYMTHRWDKQKYKFATDHLLCKWELDQYKQSNYAWLETYAPRFQDYPPHSLVKHAKITYKSEGLNKMLLKSLDYIMRNLRFIRRRW